MSIDDVFLCPLLMQTPRFHDVILSIFSHPEISNEDKADALKHFKCPAITLSIKCKFLKTEDMQGKDIIDCGYGHIIFVLNAQQGPNMPIGFPGNLHI